MTLCQYIQGCEDPAAYLVDVIHPKWSLDPINKLYGGRKPRFTAADIPSPDCTFVLCGPHADLTMLRIRYENDHITPESIWWALPQKLPLEPQEES